METYYNKGDLVERRCSKCNGKGKRLFFFKCKRCDGEGSITYRCVQAGRIEYSYSLAGVERSPRPKVRDVVKHHSYMLNKFSRDRYNDRW